MIQQSDNTLATIGEVARSTLPEAQILLFGSRARGRAAPDSDYDILIIVDRPLDIHAKLALRTHVRKQLLERGIRCDILIQSDQEIQRKKELPGHIVRSALREGVPL
jgi:predicted nucleotidyltransferase